MLELKNVSKFFYPQRSVFKNLLYSLLGINLSNSKSFFALKEISFSIPRGESVGIVGLNGAGKSTLLQIISGTMKPSSGEIKCKGRVTAILELGSGFNPNFTGIENIFLNASLYGFTRKKTSQILGEIIEFSGIGEHINLPVNTYSSGMIVRLAYSIISKLEPDILIIDEALAVGDYLFQQKCIQSMRDLKKNGSTILFVSHNLDLITELCTKVMILEKGMLSFYGSTKRGSHIYKEKLLEEKERQNPREPFNQKKNFKINSQATLESCLILDSDSKPKSFIELLNPLKIEITIVVHKQFNDLHCGFNILDHFGRVCFGTTTYALGYNVGSIKKNQKIVFLFDLDQKLKEGKYSITVGLANGGYSFPQSSFGSYIAYFENAYLFEVSHMNNVGKWSGPIFLNTRVKSNFA